MWYDNYAKLIEYSDENFSFLRTSFIAVSFCYEFVKNADSNWNDTSMFLSYSISLATIGVCVFMRLLR